ncbi:hypothetical protein Tco_0570462 [Tanacetum coccineum]
MARIQVKIFKEFENAWNPDPAQGEQKSKDAHMTNIQGEQSTAQETTTVVKAPLISESENNDKTMILHASAVKTLVADTSKKKDSDDEPPFKKLKFLILTSSIPSPTPLKSIPP